MGDHFKLCPNRQTPEKLVPMIEAEAAVLENGVTP